MRGPHFRDNHRLLDEQADSLLGMTDEIAERARKFGEATVSLHRRDYEWTRLADNTGSEVDVS